jgi:uncharacterized DUF497 family protein
MIFEWDAAKAEANLAKHRVAFEDAQFVWDDPLHVIIFDRIEQHEERWWAIGMAGPVAIVVVVHVYPDVDEEDRVRIISARKATRQERRIYEEGP